MTGTYEDAGEYAGKRYYQHDSDWFIWWFLARTIWVISNTPGETVGSWWEHADPNIEGMYGPNGDAEGIATVTRI